MKERWLDIAEILDAYRVFPRVFCTGYGYLAWDMHTWIRGLPDITAAQSAYAAAVIGLCVPLLGWYFSTGRKWQ